MKKIRIILFLGTLLFIVGCSDNVEETIQEEQGLDIEKRQLIHVNGPGWLPCEAAELKIFIPPCLTSESEAVWNAAILDALDLYNNAPNVGINFEITTEFTEADIRFICNPKNRCYGGEVDEDFVNTGMSETIRLNTALDLANCDCEPGGLDVCSATHVVIHELAHSLGFFHNNSTNPNTVLIEGTPDNDDPNSIINGGDILDWCNMPCEFSEFDLIALQAIYPPFTEVCAPPSQPPFNFTPICVGDFQSICHDFGSLECLETIVIVSSDKKMTVIIEGTEVCLNYIWTKPTTVELKVTFINGCGDAETAFWDIDIINCEEPDVVDPPDDDDDPANDCSNFDNPCPCDTVADCPPGWKCIGGGGNKICIQI